MTTSLALTVIEFARHAAGNLTTFSGAYSLTSARLQSILGRGVFFARKRLAKLKIVSHVTRKL
jgi:hypothetical protein